MPPVLIANPLQLDLSDIGPVAEPVGEPLVQLKCLVAGEFDDGRVEASPGRWRRHVGESKAELSHFNAGRCTFTPDGGDPIEINAGDAVYFPPRSTGTWNVRETVHKTFVTFEY
jgi:uncharacterized protein